MKKSKAILGNVSTAIHTDTANAGRMEGCAIAQVAALEPKRASDTLTPAERVMLANCYFQLGRVLEAARLIAAGYDYERAVARLREVEGEFTASFFVRNVTGVDNVCERSAKLLSGGTLIKEKTTGNEVTLAAAERPTALDWTCGPEEL